MSAYIQSNQRQIKVIQKVNQNKMRRSKKNSHALLDSDQSQSQPEIKQQYVRAQRKKKSTPSTQDMMDQSQDVLDIHDGDNYIRQHLRPAFLKRWDGSSNLLELTQEQLEKMSPMLRIYWEYKSKNMNCIIFVQIGTVQFFAFEDDAIKLHELFKKRLKKYSNYLMVNFWSKEIQLAKIQLFERKIPVLMLNEVEDQQYKKKYGILKRQITEVITPSIYLTMEPKKFRQRMMLGIFTVKNQCGVVCIDVETNHFYIQQHQGNENQIMHEIRRLINKYRPVELVIEKKDQFVKRIAKQICQPYIIQTTPLPLTLFETIKAMKQISQQQIFKRLISLYIKQSVEEQSAFSLYPIIKVLSMILNYMKNLTLEAKIFGQGLFQFCDSDQIKLKPMFDAQVYENLEVFNLKDEQDSFGKQGTLYHYLNHCNTNSGQKLLKKWIDQPLRTIPEISKRQIAIENLLQKNGQILNIHKQLLKFQKLERRVGSIYHWALKSQEQGKSFLTRQIKFDKDYDQNKNPAVMRIKQIHDILKVLLSVETFFEKLSKYTLQSELLKRSCRVIDAGNLYGIQSRKLEQVCKKGLPSIQKLVYTILSKIHINQNNGQIEPAFGINQVFDFEKSQIDEINEKLSEELANWKKKLGVTKAFYVSVRARNQIQVPLAQVKSKKFHELIFSSQTTKMIRYVTAETSNLSDELIQHEKALAVAYQPFSHMMTKQFCAHKHIWDMYLNSIAKIDVLMSLAKTSAQMIPKCLPIFTDNGLSFKNGFHVGLLQVKQKQDIIGNSLDLKNNQRILLLTGPNMGGKSTLLRQTCLLAILAQIGCFLPCEKYQSIVFDQIFCRIGASDRIIEGKSTFYVELEQTKRIIDQATPNSLVIIDELGRGTSTYDGMALASSILKYISSEIECYTLFSTHYFSLTEQYLLNPRIICGKIGYQFDQKCQQIKFTYQLQKGIAQKSFANQVASQVGISKQTLEIAKRKSYEIEIKNKMKSQSSQEFEKMFEQIKKFVKEETNIQKSL